MPALFFPEAFFMRDPAPAYVPALWTLKTDDTLGLALSGGGFRASLFHIGVLARLAELDLLRRVTALSTVSGGSIIGAYYYMKLKELLEGRRKDAAGVAVAPSSQAYVDIVAEIETEFLSAVQENVRMRALLDPLANARMIFADDYSRSDRMAEVYNESFYRRFSSRPDGRVLLSDLLIAPVGETKGFGVHDYNRRSDFKIPILKINATALNSGARWTFTATDLGEEPHPHDIDTIRLRPRIRYDDQSIVGPRREKLDSIGLSQAVAASACVPAIFTPLAIHGLYPPAPGEKEFVVELVDGGVYDNQGVQALIAEKCAYVICSDASGQLEEQRTPDSKLLPVAMRANDIGMNRVRSECFGDLGVCPGAPNFAFFHLRDAFAGNAQYPALPGPNDHKGGPADGHIYALSNIRTDLDAFSDTEAFTLMYDGYCLSDYFLQRDSANATLGAGLGGAPVRPWRFLDIRDKIVSDAAPLREKLGYGKYLFVKSFFADPGRFFAVTGVFVAVALALAVDFWDWIAAFYAFLVQDALFYGLPVVAVLAGVYYVLTSLDDAPVVLDIADWFRQFRSADNTFMVALCYPLGLVGAAVAAVNLYIYYPIFLRAGKVP
jgi:predicted acylesterase/phospholipase RssA